MTKTIQSIIDEATTDDPVSTAGINGCIVGWIRPLTYKLMGRIAAENAYYDTQLRKSKRNNRYNKFEFIGKRK